ncbi:MAG: helicase-related protein, partial [Chloroflexota bacterium]
DGVLRAWAERQHKLSSVMIRNRKREVLKGEMVDRRAHIVRVNLTGEERDLHREVNEYIRHAYAQLSGNQALGLVLTTFRKLLVSSPHALAGSLERRAARIEQVLNGVESGSGRFNDYELEELSETLESTEELDDLLGLTGGLSAEEAQEEVKTLKDLSARARAVADPYDSKAHELLLAVKPLLEGDSTEKVLIFTQFLETQSYLQRLFEERGYKVALFHGEGGRSGYSKQAEFRRFKRDPTVRVMISTEVGGEGLNFQFCHVMFNYDLPWNPMRIEQRIGRLDRIGQKRDVQIYNFLLDGTLDGRILSVLQDRIQLFERTIGNLDPILGEDIKDEIERIVLADETEAEKELAEWEESIEERVREAREAEEKMADFIMDARSFRRDTVDELLGRNPPLSNEDIESFALDFLGRYPTGTVESHGDDLYTISVPGRFKEDCRRLYGIHLHDRYKGTFDPATAIENETIDFFAFGHPLFDAMIQFCMDDEMMNRLDARTAQRILHHSDHAGCKGIQFNYALRFDGVRTYKKLIPVFLRLNGEYDERLSQLVLSLPSQNTDGRRGRIQVASTKVERLEERSEEVMSEILRRELREARQRNKEDYTHEREKLQRLFDYRVARQRVELERRQARLKDAREKGQERILPALEGQVKKTEGRIKDLEEQREQALGELEEGRRTKPGYDLLNIACVEIQRGA